MIDLDEYREGIESLRTTLLLAESDAGGSDERLYNQLKGRREGLALALQLLDQMERIVAAGRVVYRILGPEGRFIASTAGNGALAQRIAAHHPGSTIEAR